VQCVAMVLGIRLQMVSKIPVQRHMVDKRAYYRKGDIDDWLQADLAREDSLARQLRAQHAESLKRIAKEPSRRYVRGQASKSSAKEEKPKAAGFAWPTPAKGRG